MFLRELSCNSESNLLTKYGNCFPSEISVVVDLFIISIPKAYLFLQPYNALKECAIFKTILEHSFALPPSETM